MKSLDRELLKAVRSDIESVSLHLSTWCCVANEIGADPYSDCPSENTSHVHSGVKYLVKHADAFDRLATFLHRGGFEDDSLSIVQAIRYTPEGEFDILTKRWSIPEGIAKALDSAELLSMKADAPREVYGFAIPPSIKPDDHSPKSHLARLTFVRQQLNAYIDALNSRRIDSDPLRVENCSEFGNCCRGLAGLAQSNGDIDSAREILRIASGDCIVGTHTPEDTFWHSLEEASADALVTVELLALGAADGSNLPELDTPQINSVRLPAASLTEGGKTATMPQLNLNESDSNILDSVAELQREGVRPINQNDVTTRSGVSATTTRDTLSAMVRFGVLNHGGRAEGYSLNEWVKPYLSSVATGVGSKVGTEVVKDE